MVPDQTSNPGVDHVGRDPAEKGFAPVILVINPGSTSTKLALYRGYAEASSFEMEWKLPTGLHGAALEAEVNRYVRHIEAFLKPTDLRPEAVAGRGGFIDTRRGRLGSGVYRVAAVREGCVEICRDLYQSVVEAPELDHASNYGIPVAARLALTWQIPAFTVDPIVVDDMADEARFSGYASIQRRSVAHVLSVRAMGRKAGAQIGRAFNQARMVAVHLGGGITVAALRDGKLVDVNNALLGGGPFSPQRVGTLPMRDLIDLCYSGRFTRKELQTELTKRGGLVSYLGDDNFQNIEARIAGGDPLAAAVVQGMVYQVAKEIGAMAIAAGAPLDAVVFSGGLSRSRLLMDALKSRIGHLAPVLIYPGSLEMEAMAHGVCRVLSGEEPALDYTLTKPNPS